jgi:diguanylate cyclase (GGDEF)-like protein/PAS domain S-box-containing protein
MMTGCILGDGSVMTNLTVKTPNNEVTTIDNNNNKSLLLDDVQGVMKDSSPLFFSIVDQSSNAIVITDLHHNILYVNKKFEQLSGYPLHEVFGNKPNILKSNKTPLSTYREMNSTLKEGKQWQGEFINRHRDGAEYVEEAIISPIRDRNDRIICFLAEKKNITDLKRAKREIHHLSHFDTLTGLPNRNYFINEVDKMLAYGKFSRNHFSILFADLKRFKELNDTYGHYHGDTVLREVAKRFISSLGPNDILARVGGDEFAVLHRHSSPESLEVLVGSLASVLKPAMTIDEHDHFLGVRIGSATWPVDSTSLSQLLVCADIAMYNAKQQRRTYIRYTTELGEKSNREFNLASSLERAVEDDNLHLVFQPKFDLNRRHFVGAEALLRWVDPVFGAISPAEFIPIAEKNGLMNIIGGWVINQSCAQLARWKREKFDLNGPLAINISIQQIEHPSFYEQLMAAVHRHQVNPFDIELEVTESILISDPERTSNVLKSLAQAGIGIAIDDFGTGYSSLSYLKKIHATTLKIDKSFIDNVVHDLNDRAIVEAVISLAHNLGIKIVAEGVEQKDQSDLLQSLGCDIVQGYLYAKPQRDQELQLSCVKRVFD